MKPTQRKSHLSIDTKQEPGEPAHLLSTEPIRLGPIEYASALVPGLLVFSLYMVSLTGDRGGRRGRTRSIDISYGYSPSPRLSALVSDSTWVYLASDGKHCLAGGGGSSAFWGAATVFLAHLLLRKLGLRLWAAGLGAVALGCSGEFWQQSVIPEVYALNAFLILMAIFWLYLWREHRNDRFLFAFAATFGLGLTNHNTMALLGPVFVVFVIYTEPCFWKRWSTYATCTGLALACTLVYLYLPIRSAANPPTDWGNPETWEGFWDHVTREQYKFGFPANPRSLYATLTQAWAFLKLYSWEFTPLFCWMPFLGVAIAWRRNRPATALLGSVALMVIIGLLLVLNFLIDRESLWLNNVFWVPAYMMLALFLAFVLDALGTTRVLGQSLAPLR